MAAQTRTKDFHDPDPAQLVLAINKWLEQQVGYGLADDFCFIGYDDGLWHARILVRAGAIAERLTYTQNPALYEFKKNIYINGFSQVVFLHGEEHIFGGVKA